MVASTDNHYDWAHVFVSQLKLRLMAKAWTCCCVIREPIIAARHLCQDLTNNGEYEYYKLIFQAPAVHWIICR
jgi:hypothetical protein